MSVKSVCENFGAVFVKNLDMSDEISFWDEKDPSCVGLETRKRADEVVSGEKSRWPSASSSSLEGIRIGIPQVFSLLPSH